MLCDIQQPFVIRVDSNFISLFINLAFRIIKNLDIKELYILMQISNYCLHFISPVLSFDYS